MDEEVCHLRIIAEHRRAADELRAQIETAMRDLEDTKLAYSYNIDPEGAKLKAARAINVIVDLSQRIEELGQ